MRKTIKHINVQKDRMGDLKIDIGLQILELRLLTNVTQDGLARLIKTKQPSIARAERGATTPSLTFLNKIAVALNTSLIYPKFALVEQNENLHQLDNLRIRFNLHSTATTPVNLHSTATIPLISTYYQLNNTSHA